MSWKRILLIIVGSLVALLLLGAGALAYLVLRLDVRGEVERAVESATGRDAVISGDVGVSYWPVLGLRAGDVTLANVEGGRAPVFIAADEIDIGVELRPLLNRQVIVRRLVLQRPRINLEVNAEGQPNWILAPTPREGPPPATPPSEPVVDVNRTNLREVRINDGEVSYFDGRRGAGWVVGAVDIRTALTSLDEPMRARGSVQYAERQVDLDIEVGRPGALIRGQQSPITIDIESELVNANFQGQTLATSGEIAGLVRANGASLRNLAAWIGSPIQGGVGFEQFAVSGRLQVARGVYSFTNAGFVVDLVRGRGDFQLSERNNKPYLSGRLELFDFDLNPYLTGDAPPQAAQDAVVAAAEAPATATLEAPIAEAAAAATDDAPRALDVREAPSSAPIDFTGLQAFNADLELVTRAVLVQRMRLDSTRLNLVINDGYLAATLHTMRLYGGSGRGRFEIDARAPATSMVYDLNFTGVEARRFLTDAINFTNIEGRAELSVNVRTQGRTQSELIGALDGRTHIEVVSGTLHGVDLGGVATTIRNALRGELIAPEARTPFQGMSATFAIADGVLASDNLSFNTEDLRIPGIGVIDAQRRRMDARLAPRSPRGGLVFPFSIRGAWSALSYASDSNGRANEEILARVRQVEAAARAQ